MSIRPPAALKLRRPGFSRAYWRLSVSDSSLGRRCSGYTLSTAIGVMQSQMVETPRKINCAPGLSRNDPPCLSLLGL